MTKLELKVSEQKAATKVGALTKGDVFKEPNSDRWYMLTPYCPNRDIMAIRLETGGYFWFSPDTPVAAVAEEVRISIQ